AGNTEDAKIAYEEALKLVGAPTLRFADLLGNFYERQGDVAKATEIYDNLLEGDKYEALGRKGQIRILENRTPTKRISNPREGLAEILYHLGGILFSERGDRLSMTLGSAALYLDPTNSYYRLQIGRMTEDQKRYNKALAMYQAIPNSSDVFVRSRLLAIDAMFEQERWPEAENLLNELMEMEGQKFASLTRLGDMYRYKKEFEKAAEVYEEAIETVDDPQRLSWFNYYYAGIANEQSKNWSEAERLFKIALELEPDQPLVLNYLAYSWVEKGQHLDQSLEMLKTAVAKRPEDGYVVDSLGWVFYRLKRFEEAVPELERAVALRPGDAVINDHLGDAYFRVGRTREAEFQWRRALSFKPDDKVKDAINKKLETGVVVDEVLPEGEDI
ncbi:MAG: tetratricopeptide repeat protein, partial [Alphaproteobacteria bacterium]